MIYYVVGVVVMVIFALMIFSEIHGDKDRDRMNP